jgi:carboxymethylenebutenolidase
MCFPFDASPPEIPAALRSRPPIAGGAAGERLTLASADGTDFSAFLARVDGDVEAGVVILPDVRGLFRFYEELAERFADAGVPAIAVDYFGRTAGLGPRGEDFDYQPHVAATRAETVAADVRAAGEHLREQTNVSQLFTVGFCFGGAQSFLQAQTAEYAGVVGFYGLLAGRDPHLPSVLERSRGFRTPVLGLFAGDDHAIPLTDVEAFGSALAESGVPHEVKVYDGLPHSFFDRRQDVYADECADAWQRVLGFLGQTARV